MDHLLPDISQMAELKTNPEEMNVKLPHCRTNSRRGQIDPEYRSYPPVKAILRALDILLVVNKQGISTVRSIFDELQIPKPTIVRMLETLMHAEFIVRDNMCGGYRVTQNVASLSDGYSGMSRIIGVACPLAIALTRQIKWPIGLGVLDGDEIEIQYWTGTISPWAHTNTVLGHRPDLIRSAMGRVYVAFCTEAERERIIRNLRQNHADWFNEYTEAAYRSLLQRVRHTGYASRDPRTKPLRMTTYSVPILQRGQVEAVMSVSFYTTAVANSDIKSQILDPLMATRVNIEHALEFINNQEVLGPNSNRDFEVSF
jgi:IclR family transcriptional regulator, mhp operon transcriptional activator